MDTEELLLWYAGYVLCLFFYLRSVTTNIYAEESKTALGILVYAGLIKSKMLREKEGNWEQMCVIAYRGSQDQDKWNKRMW